MVFDNNLKAITRDVLLPKVVDSISVGSPHMSRVFSNMAEWRGEALTKGFRFTTAGNGQFFSGVGNFNTNAVDTKIRLSFDIRGYSQPVVIPGLEKVVNANSDRSVELVAVAMEEAANEAADAIGEALYTGDGGNGVTFLGLNDAADDGGTTANYGGQSRATYTALQGTDTSVGGPLTTAAMRAMWDAVSRGSEHPSVIYTTEAIWADYEELAQVVMSINQDGTRKLMKPGDALSAELGFEYLMYSGVPVLKDELCPSGTMYFVNERHMKFYGARVEGVMEGYTQIKFGGNKTLEGAYDDKSYSGFAWSGFIRPDNQFAEVGHIILAGNYVSFNPARQGRLTNIT